MIRLGFIGSGGYGRMHVDGFLALQAQGLVKITGLADSSPAVLDALQALPELRGTRCFIDYRDLLAAGDIDAVVISAPIHLHQEITLAALERGLFILLEKPPVPLLSQLEELIAADTEGRVMVAFQHVYSGLIQRLKREIVAGRAGRLFSISAQGLWPRPTAYYRRCGWAGQLEWRAQPVLDGPCTNALAHYVNIVLYLAGGDSAAFATPTEVVGEAYRARPDLPTYDTGCLTGSCDSGIRFFIGFSHAASDLSPVEITIRGTTETLSLLDDCETLRSGDGSLARGNDGRDSLWRAFLAFAEGDRTQNKTPLQATRAYVLATNLMFLSSGGIHTIPLKYVHPVAAGTDDAIFAIENIAPLFRQCAAQIAPLCQAAAPWAKKTPLIAPSHLSEDKLMAVLRLANAST